MLKKIMVVVLVGLITNIAVFAAGSGKNKQDDAAKVRAEITKLGIGRDAKITVKLKNGKKIKGHVSETKADGFVVTDKKGIQTEIGFSEVRQAKGQNMSLGVSILITAAVIGGIVLVLGLLVDKGKLR